MVCCIVILQYLPNAGAGFESHWLDKRYTVSEFIEMWARDHLDRPSYLSTVGGVPLLSNSPLPQQFVVHLADVPAALPPAYPSRRSRPFKNEGEGESSSRSASTSSRASISSRAMVYDDIGMLVSHHLCNYIM